MSWFKKNKEEIFDGDFERLVKNHPEFVLVNRKGTRVNVVNVVEVIPGTNRVKFSDETTLDVEPEYWDNFIKQYNSRQ